MRHARLLDTFLRGSDHQDTRTVGPTPMESYGVAMNFANGRHTIRTASIPLPVGSEEGKANKMSILLSISTVVDDDQGVQEDCGNNGYLKVMLFCLCTELERRRPLNCTWPRACALDRLLPVPPSLPLRLSGQALSRMDAELFCCECSSLSQLPCLLSSPTQNFFTVY